MFHRILFSTSVPQFSQILTLFITHQLNVSRAVQCQFFQSSHRHISKCVYRCLYWNDSFFAFVYDERSLDDLGSNIPVLKRIVAHMDACCLSFQVVYLFPSCYLNRSSESKFAWFSYDDISIRCSFKTIKITGLKK